MYSTVLWMYLLTFGVSLVRVVCLDSGKLSPLLLYFVVMLFPYTLHQVYVGAIHSHHGPLTYSQYITKGCLSDLFVIQIVHLHAVLTFAAITCLLSAPH